MKEQKTESRQQSSGTSCGFFGRPGVPLCGVQTFMRSTDVARLREVCTDTNCVPNSAKNKQVRHAAAFVRAIRTIEGIMRCRGGHNVFAQRDPTEHLWMALICPNATAPSGVYVLDFASPMHSARTSYLAEWLSTSIPLNSTSALKVDVTTNMRQSMFDDRCHELADMRSPDVESTVQTVPHHAWNTHTVYVFLTYKPE
jgi:hypothetical protein